MLLIIHIIFAFGSVALMAGATAGRWRNRSADYSRMVQASCLGFCGLMASGFTMVIVSHANLLSVCTSGLAWMAGLAAMYALYTKLATSEQ
jgi:hypothetical protein